MNKLIINLLWFGVCSIPLISIVIAVIYEFNKNFDGSLFGVYGMILVKAMRYNDRDIRRCKNG